MSVTGFFAGLMFTGCDPPLSAAATPPLNIRETATETRLRPIALRFMKFLTVAEKHLRGDFLKRYLANEVAG
jgi:hypothetical protein